MTVEKAVIICLFSLPVFAMDKIEITPPSQPDSISEFLDEVDANSRMMRQEKTKQQLYKYAIKELVEKHEDEKRERISQQRQKWCALCTGTFTTSIPLLIAIIEAFKLNKCS